MDLKSTYLEDLERRVNGALESETPEAFVFTLMSRHLPDGDADTLWFTLTPHGGTLRRSVYPKHGNAPTHARVYIDAAQANQLRQQLQVLRPNQTMRPIDSGWRCEVVLGDRNGLRTLVMYPPKEEQAVWINQMFNLVPLDNQLGRDD